MSRKRPVDQTIVKISTPADILGVLPHRLGFHPRESLVVVCLEGPRKRDRLVMRVDLAGTATDHALAQDMAARVRHTGASHAVIVCYTDAPSPGRDLPRAALMDALAECLAGHDIGVVETLLVRGGRWWSYQCTDVVCCPAAGTPLLGELTSAAQHYAAESALRGASPLVDRTALEGSIEPARHRVAVATRARAAGVAAEAVLTAVARDGVEAPGRLALATLRRLVLEWSGGRDEVSPDEAALVALGLRDKLARDEAMTMVLDSDAGVLVALLTDLVSRVDGPDAAPVCTLLAWTAYAQGGGALATVAADRALRCFPGYEMARLLVESMSRMVDPDVIREVAEQVRTDLAG